MTSALAGGRRLDAVLLDVDGVLVDTEEAVVELWQVLCLRLGRPPLDDADHAHIVGCAVEHTVDHLFGTLGPDVVDRAHLMLADLEPALPARPVEGAAELVHDLCARGVPVALVTGASRTRLDAVVRSLGAAGQPLTAVTAGESEGKPHPGPYLLAARRLGVDATRCVVVEDAVAGVRSAIAAGAICLGLAPAGSPRGGALLDAGAEAVLETLDAVRAALRPVGDRSAGLPAPTATPSTTRGTSWA